MAIYRRTLMGLAILHLIFTALTATIGLFADGGAVYSRLIISALHPVTALVILLLVFAPRLSKSFVVIVVAFSTINILADVTLAALIGFGTIKGDWELPLFFTIVPTIAIIYAVNQLRSLPTQSEGSELSVNGETG